MGRFEISTKVFERVKYVCGVVAAREAEISRLVLPSERDVMMLLQIGVRKEVELGVAKLCVKT